MLNIYRHLLLTMQKPRSQWGVGIRNPFVGAHIMRPRAADSRPYMDS